MLTLRTLAVGLVFLSPLDKCTHNTSTVAADPGTTLAPAPPTTPASIEQGELTEAKNLCAAGDCQTAHERLAVGLPQNSPVRASQDFKDLENRWAASTIAGASNDPDLLARRRALEAVTQSPVVDPQLRAQAKQTLAALPTAPAPATAGKPGPTDLEIAKKLAVKEPRKAKELIANKIATGIASQDEKDFLQALCKKTNDKACLTMLKATASH